MGRSRRLGREFVDKVGEKLVSMGRSISSRGSSPIPHSSQATGYTQPETQVFHMDDVDSPARPKAWLRRPRSSSSSSSSSCTSSRDPRCAGYHSPSSRSSSEGSSYDIEPPSPPPGPYHPPVYGLSSAGSDISRPTTSALESPLFTFDKQPPLPSNTSYLPSWAAQVAASQTGETEIFTCELSPIGTDFGERLDPFGSSSPVSPLGSLGYDCGSEQSSVGGSHVEQEERWGGHGSPDLSSDLDHPRSFSDDPSTGYGSARGSTASIAIPGQGSPTSLERGSEGATNAPISIFH